jgi:hypothetical protein
MELYIDNLPADIDRRTSVSLSLSIATATDPQKGRTGYTRSLRLPVTARNRAIFGYAEQIHARDRFNATAHTGRLEVEGAVLIEGPLYLSECAVTASGGEYVVYIVGASKEWVREASSTSLRNTPIDWSATIDGENIAQSWVDNTPVRFLPVLRESYRADHSSGSVIPAMKILSSDDYHPFIHAATLLRAIFAQNGYAVESDFVDSEMFNSLYISGNYPTRDVSVLKANMDFLARRIETTTATANSAGRVYADPYRTNYTVGNLVDIADPSMFPGETDLDGLFTNGDCFQMEGDRVIFVPTSEVSVGFQYHLRYVTDYYMTSRRELAGFNRVYIGEQSDRVFTLTNPYPDRRSSFRHTRTYTLAVFDHSSGRQYQLRYTRQNQSGTAQVSTSVVSTRFSTVTVEIAVAVSNPELYSRTSSSGSWSRYTGDWALYDGFVGETGTLDVELTLRSAPQTISPSNPKFFDDIYFGGALSGQQITVLNECWVRPVFYAQPGEGSVVEFADVAAHDVSQMDFINALRQMFNLCFQTDNRAHTVRIEPRDDFYSDTEPLDWTDRIDLSRPVVVEELGADLARQMAWSYRSGDGAVMRYNREVGGQMGRWSVAIENCAAGNGTSEWQNPMFSPSLNATESYRGAMSASLVQAGDTSVETLDRTEDLNFAPKIVRYTGLAELPVGEVWGWPTGGSVYPHIAFHDPESGFTLCFEDRDSVQGLHTRYDHDVRVWNNSKRVTMWLNLAPVDVEELSSPTGYGADFRRLYRLDLDGEVGLYHLEEVCDYSPSAISTKCIFIKQIP